MQHQCPPRVTTTFESDPPVGPTVAVSIAQAADDPGGQVLELYAKVDGVPYLAARARVASSVPSQRAPYRGRVAMLETVPGVEQWTLRVRGSTDPTARRPLGVDMRSDAHACAFRPIGIYRHSAVVQAGTITVPDGARVRWWSLRSYAAAAEATLQIGSSGLTLVRTPAGTSIEDHPEHLFGPQDFAFGGDPNAMFGIVSWVEV